VAFAFPAFDARIDALDQGGNRGDLGPLVSRFFETRLGRHFEPARAAAVMTERFAAPGIAWLWLFFFGAGRRGLKFASRIL